MKYYIKNNKVKSAKQIIVYRNGMQTINPSEELILADGWIEYIPEVYEPTEEEILAETKERKIEDILYYDSSKEVNSFFMKEFQMWLDKATRVGLKLRFDAEIASGQTTTTLWYDGVPFNLELESAMQMLNAIELYASACYDNTQMHIAYVKVMEDVEIIQSYDYTTGYPEKLRF